MSDYSHYSGLQFMGGGLLFFMGFYELFPAIQQLGFGGVLELPLAPVLCLVFVVTCSALARFAGSGLGTSMLISLTISVFALLIYFPSAPLEAGLMVVSSFGTVIATPTRR